MGSTTGIATWWHGSRNWADRFLIPYAAMSSAHDNRLPHNVHLQSKRRVDVRRVDECGTLDEVFRSCLPAFGGAYLRRVYSLLDQAIGAGCPLTLAIAGPVTVSGQHQTWLIPLLETGWVAYLSTTDAVCYHDGHRSLDEHPDPIFEVPIFGDDGVLRDEKTIRVTDMAFDEDVLFQQDRFMTACLLRPEFQKAMTGTELRYLLGRIYAAQGVSGPRTEGSRSSCRPAEAVTWGKVDRDTYQSTTESAQADYSMVMPFLVKALLDNRAAYARRAAEIGEEALFQEEPKAAGYLRPREGYRLFEQRDALVGALSRSVRDNGEWLRKTLRYPLAFGGNPNP